MDAIEHTASPFHFDAVDPDGEPPLRDDTRSLMSFSELIKPAVNGTVGILKSILKDEYVSRARHLTVRSKNGRSK